jgi:hypothetical protein
MIPLASNSAYPLPEAEFARKAFWVPPVRQTGFLHSAAVLNVGTITRERLVRNLRCPRCPQVRRIDRDIVVYLGSGPLFLGNFQSWREEITGTPMFTTVRFKIPEKLHIPSRLGLMPSFSQKKRLLDTGVRLTNTGKARASFRTREKSSK